MAHPTQTLPSGHVAFVGAGPGDPELLTVRAMREIQSAEVILHDQLVPEAILSLASDAATLVPVGKTGFGPSMKQDDINALIIAHASGGARTVRLKAGDPGVFGRLDEETEALDAALVIAAPKAREAGVKIKVVTSLYKLLPEIETNPAAVLVDLNAKGISPTSLIVQVKQRNPHLPVIAYGQNTASTLLDGARNAGADHVLQKSENSLPGVLRQFS